MSVSGNAPASNEGMLLDRVDMRKSKGSGLRINTQAVGVTAPRPLRTEPTHGEKLYADFIRTHMALRGELDLLTRKLRAANERANEAERRARNAENMGYQANSANFQKVKELEYKHRVEIQNKARRYQMLAMDLENQQRRNEALEMRCKDLSWMIEKVKEGLEQEQQREISAFISEHTKTTRELGLMASGRS